MARIKFRKTETSSSIPVLKVSLIHFDTAESLALKGKDTYVTIAKVGG